MTLYMNDVEDMSLRVCLGESESNADTVLEERLDAHPMHGGHVRRWASDLPLSRPSYYPRSLPSS